jgi:DNA-directed RNA polymerase subunit M/transcription elongation factor TFIIS
MASQKTKIVNRLTCPFCDNDSEFFEVAEDAIITTYYSQNKDGSFTANDQNSEILGNVRLYCGSCGENLDLYHQRFREMIF